MLLICKCLNVSISLKNNQDELSSVDINSLSLTSDEESESFFSEELKEVEIGHVVRQVKSLVQVKTVGVWMIEHCLNCSTNCFSTASGRATALVNAALITNPDAIARLKACKDYSPVFRIIVKPLVTEGYSEVSDLRQSPQKIQTALSSLEHELNEAVRKQVLSTEEKIRIFTEQEYGQLEKFRDRATKDHRALVQRIHESQLRVDKGSLSSAAAESESRPLQISLASANQKVVSRRKTEPFTMESSQSAERKGRSSNDRSVYLFSRSSNAGSNSLDSEGLFVLEGMEDSVVNEPGHSEGDSDTDHDDSGSHDEGIDVHRKRTSSFQMAKSLPVNVPVYSVPFTDLEKDDDLPRRSSPLNAKWPVVDKSTLVEFVCESVDAVDIAASIKALARSVHGDAVFGDLPRPRFSTQI